MAHKKDNTNLAKLLLQCVTQPAPMPSMPERLSQMFGRRPGGLSYFLHVSKSGCSEESSSSNIIEHLNREIRRRGSVVGIFPNEDSYIRPVTTYLVEYAEDWSVSRAYLRQESIETTLRPAV